ncbi:hypothetical protein CIK06_15520 [Plantactinospora sp. KBS50]|nr:hypothetical protein CIK06_15520 [Plantactinospora sp. KBS50]
MTVGRWFRTDLDEPPVSAAVPVELSGGREPALAVVDQLARGPASWGGSSATRGWRCCVCGRWTGPCGWR